MDINKKEEKDKSKEKETKVRFYYFSVKCENLERKSNVKLNFEKCFDKLYKNYQKKLNKPLIFDYDDEFIKVKLEDIGIPSGGIDKLYRLCFSKMRNFGLPKKTKEIGSATDLNLSDDEYISEEMTILYDVINNIIMLQVNGHSINYKKVQDCLQAILYHATSNDKLYLTLSLLIDKSMLDKIQQKKGYTKSLSVNIHDSSNKSNIIKDLFSSFNSKMPNDLNVELKISVPHKKNNKTKYIPERIIDKVLSEKDDLNKFVIKIKEGKNKRLEELDLLDGKLEDEVTMNYKEGRSLKSISVFEKMEEIYKDKGKSKALKNI